MLVRCFFFQHVSINDETAIAYIDPPIAPGPGPGPGLFLVVKGHKFTALDSGIG